ncbi:MAG TPA: glycosyltransferase [Desulfurivibrionaceae bacterium]|nr:glycosyltransferase [Desulfurivibrionaceae bacterium]
MEITPDLSLCLAYGGNPEQLQHFLATLAANADPVAYQAIVVYRAALPPPAGVFRTFPAALFFEEPDETTAAAAMNQALRLATGRYLAFWSDTILIEPGSLYRLLVLLDERPELGIVAPRLTAADGTSLANAGPLPSLFRRLPAGILPPPEHETPLPAAWLTDRALLFRREVLDDIGPLDSAFGACYADADFCRRAARAGWRLALYPAVSAEDSAPVTLPSCPSGDLARFLFRKWLAIRTGTW